MLTIGNADSDLKVHALHYANELLVCVRLSFQKILQTRQTNRNNRFSLWLRGDNLNYKSVAKEISKPPFFWLLKSSGHQSLPCLFDSRFRTTPIFGLSRDHNRKRLKTRTEWIVFEIHCITIRFSKTPHYLQLVACVWGNVQDFKNYRSLSAFIAS